MRPIPRRHGRLGLGLLAACSLVLSARAAQPGGDTVVAAHLFERAKEAAEAGQWDRACSLFAESYRLDPTAGVRLNLADCEEHRGRVATARQLYHDVALQLPPSDPRTRFAASRAEALAPRVPLVTVRIAREIPNEVRVLRNQDELSRLALAGPLPMDPGPYDFSLVQDGETLTRVHLEVREGERQDVVLDAPFRKERKPSPDKRSESANASRPWKTAGFVLTGLGVAGLTTGGITGFLAMRESDIVDAHCGADKRCDDEGLRAADATRTYGTISTISVAAGAVALAAGITLLLTQ